MITDCHTGTGARHECPILPERIEYQCDDLGLPIEEVIADRGYGRGPTYAQLREQKIRHYISLHDPNTGRGNTAQQHPWSFCALQVVRQARSLTLVEPKPIFRASML